MNTSAWVVEAAWLVNLIYWGYVWARTLVWYRRSGAKYLAKSISEVAFLLMFICWLGAMLTPILAPTTEDHWSRYLGLLLPLTFLVCAWRIHKGGRFMYERGGGTE